MKQVIVKKGTAVVEEVPIPMVHDGMVLVQNMYSTISVGTEMSSITNTGKTLWKRALENPSEVKKAVKIFRAMYIKNIEDQQIFQKFLKGKFRI